LGSELTCFLFRDFEQELNRHEMNHTMKKTKHLIGILLAAAFLAAGCASPRSMADALAKCDYAVESVRDVRLAGRPLEGQTANLASLPGIALALMRKDLPLEGRVNLKITNPNATRIALNSFKYLIEVQGKPLFEGTAEENVRLGTGESAVVPLTFKANLFGATEEKGVENVLSELFTAKSDGFLALKIKPSVKIGNQNIYYPGYITVNFKL